MNSKQIFICHSSIDIGIANRVCENLEKQGLTCWIPSREIKAGANWTLELSEAIEQCQVLVLVFSANSNKDRTVFAEVRMAFSIGKTIFPFRIENVEPGNDLKNFISSSQWCDGINPPIDDKIIEMAEKIKNVITVNYLSTSSVVSAPLKDKDQEFIPFQVIDTLRLKDGQDSAEIQFCTGDLTKLPPEAAVDVLIISAFREGYLPVTGSLIGGLHSRGVSVAELAKNKEVDLRDAFSCWMSREIVNTPTSIRFSRILCFEPGQNAKAPELVGDIFRSLAPFVGSQPSIQTVATPLVGSGYQNQNPEVMLDELVKAGVHWMSAGLPLSCLKIVCLPGPELSTLAREFSELKKKYAPIVSKKSDQFSYDVFISYAHADKQEIMYFEQIISERLPDLRLFLDRRELNTGSSWQREIYECLDDCRKVIPFFSPAYLHSKVCIEEFNIALCRHREAKDPVLAPVYLYSANLPTYMKLIQFNDCREFNSSRLESAIDNIIPNLGK